jgi:hypothetical protein
MRLDLVVVESTNRARMSKGRSLNLESDQGHLLDCTNADLMIKAPKRGTNHHCVKQNSLRSFINP